MVQGEEAKHWRLQLLAFITVAHPHKLKGAKAGAAEVDLVNPNPKNLIKVHK